MAKKMYIGVDNVARQVKKGYVGVEDKARKIKSGYYGVDGIARQFFSSDRKVIYYGQLDQLATKVYEMASASSDNYCIFFAGSTNNYSYYGVYHAYDTNLTLKRDAIVDSIYGNYVCGSGSSNGCYFIGRRYGQSNKEGWYNFDTNLVKTYSIDAYSIFVNTYPIQVTLNDKYYLTSGAKKLYYIDIDTLTLNLASNSLTTAHESGGVTSIEDYAFFLTDSGANGALDVIDSNLIITLHGYYATHEWIKGASNSQYAVFTSGTSSAVLYCFDKNLVKSTISNTYGQNYNGASASFDDYALMAGGRNPNGSATSSVISIDTNLVCDDSFTLNLKAYWLSGGSVSNNAIFAGGVQSTYIYAPYVNVFQLI